jgi:hypothetical protein
MAAVPQLLSESEKHNLTPVIGCLPKGTPIITKLRIKTVEQIKVGDEVLTHRGRFKKVLNTSTRKFKGRMYEIKLSDSKFHTKGFLLTEEHPVLIRDKDGNVNFRLPPDILSGRPTTKTISMKSSAMDVKINFTKKDSEVFKLFFIFLRRVFSFQACIPYPIY